MSDLSIERLDDSRWRIRRRGGMRVDVSVERAGLSHRVARLKPIGVVKG